MSIIEEKAKLADELLAGSCLVETDPDWGPGSRSHCCKWCGGWGIEPHPNSMAAQRGEHAHRKNCIKARYDALTEN